MRILGAIRLSNLTDESTSPERQRAAIEGFAKSEGHTIVHITEDLDISGKIPPNERPQLGPWLKRTNEWDAIVVTKPDRLSRSLRDFLNLNHELEQQGKSLISLDPKLDFSTPLGRLVANVLMSFAEFEREIISARVKDSYDSIISHRGYAGGTIPFGYRAIKNNGRGWIYEQDPIYAPIVREMVAKVLSGMSMNAVAQWLNEEGIHTSVNVVRIANGKEPLVNPKTGKVSSWSAEQVKKVLTNPAITGAIIIDGEPMRGEDGTIVNRCEGIIDIATWEKVKAAITGPAHSTYRTDANPLLGIGFCGLCGSPLHTTISSSRKYRTRHYFKCSEAQRGHTCTARNIPAEPLATYINDKLLETAGDVPMRIKDVTPALDNSAEIAKVNEAIAAWEAKAIAGESIESVTRILEGLNARKLALESLPTQDEQVSWTETGQTFAEYFSALTDSQRRQFMHDAGIQVFVDQLDDTDMYLIREEGHMPITPDTEGKVIAGILNDKWRVTIHLGDVKTLRDMAAQAA